jgi:peptidoglycan/LPS O-acetylase OafA/YrhL
MTGASSYRPDIDGLRAVAILPVLLYHAHVPGVTGGYVGVDLFFVISGYLITGILAREMDRGSFSILRFYERRARRILPALLAMLVVVLAVAAWLYLPGDFPGVPRSALATLGFASNLEFFAETGYFATGADTKPLLHTWSLAIEEQFYLFFPLLLLVLTRWPRWRTGILALLTLASFALAVATQGGKSGFAFYLLPPRAWELFVGGLLALAAVPPLRGPRMREGVALAGLAAVLIPVLLYTPKTVFPGVTALAPVLGAAALLHAAPGTRVGRLLALPPLVGIGLLSYSLYLWHWPLIVFVQYATETKLAGGWQAAAVLGSLLLGWASWRYVERPFRDPARFGRAAIFRWSAAGIGAVALVAGAMALAGEWPQRFDPMVARMADARLDYSPVRDRCHDSDPDKGRMPCVLGAPGVPPGAILWGDSHGVEYAWVLSRMLGARHQSLLQRTYSSCPPLAGYESPRDPACGRLNRQVLAQILADPRLHTVYLAGFWAGLADARIDMAPGLDRTIARLLSAGRRVVLIGPVPANRIDVPEHLARLARAGQLDQAVGRDRAAVAPVERQLARVAARWQPRGLVYVDPAALLCDRDRCAIVKDGRPLYFDYHHPSVAGAALIVRGFRDQLLPR